MDGGRGEYRVRVERAAPPPVIEPTRETRVERTMTPRGDIVTTTTISETRQADIGDVTSYGQGMYRNIQIGPEGTTVTTTTQKSDEKGVRDVMTSVLRGGVPSTSSPLPPHSTHKTTSSTMEGERVIGVKREDEGVKKPRLEEQKKEHKEEVEQLLVDEEHTVYTVPIGRT